MDNCFLKLNNPVEYSEKMTINHENFELYAVIAHSGTNTGGHYFAFVKKNEVWYKCDDERTMKAKPNEAICP